MVVDYIENIKEYICIHDDFKKGIEFVLTLFDKPEGKYECENFFAMVQTGETKDNKECKFEAHKKYIDVQFMLKGNEILEWNDIKKLKTVTNYSEEDDVTLYEGEGPQIAIQNNMFYILYPWDAHKPCTHKIESTEYKKIVLKLSI